MKTNESESAQGVTEVLGKRRLDGYHGDFHGASLFNSDLKRLNLQNTGVLKPEIQKFVTSAVYRKLTK